MISFPRSDKIAHRRRHGLLLALGALAGLAALTMQTPAVKAADNQEGMLRCLYPYTYVANEPSGLVTGNCLGYPAGATAMERSALSDVVQDTKYRYDGGYITGTYQGCGWIRQDRDVVTNSTAGPFSRCALGSASSSINRDQFVLKTDGCSGTSSCAGTPRANPRACQKWANFRSWLPSQSPSNAIGRPVPAGAKTRGRPRLWWRYYTKYVSAAGVRYVMVHDTGAGDGDGEWAFVAASCMGL